MGSGFQRKKFIAPNIHWSTDPTICMSSKSMPQYRWNDKFGGFTAPSHWYGLEKVFKTKFELYFLGLRACQNPMKRWFHQCSPNAQNVDCNGSQLERWWYLGVICWKVAVGLKVVQTECRLFYCVWHFIM